jgi:plastocyanin
MGQPARLRTAALVARVMLAVALVATVWAAAGSAHARRHVPRCHGHAPTRRCRPSPPAPRPRPAPDAVSVHAHEYRLTLSRPAVRGGKVIVEFANEGEDPHNLRLAPVTGPDDATGPSQNEFPTLSSGKLGTQTLTLTPGTWRLWCSLPGHDAAGMHATLTVTATATASGVPRMTR